MIGRCPKCKKIKFLTKHSKIGGHQPPFVRRCVKCHDDIHDRPHAKPKIPGKVQKGTRHGRKKKQ